MDMARFETADDPGFVSICGELSRWVREIDTERREASSQNDASNEDGPQDQHESSGTQGKNSFITTTHEPAYLVL
jgi:hypothetical protein